MLKQTEVCSYDRIIFSDKNKWTINTHNNRNDSQRNSCECKNSSCMLYDSIYVVFMKWQNYICKEWTSAYLTWV